MRLAPSRRKKTKGNKTARNDRWRESGRDCGEMTGKQEEEEVDGRRRRGNASGDQRPASARSHWGGERVGAGRRRTTEREIAGTGRCGLALESLFLAGWLALCSTALCCLPDQALSKQAEWMDGGTNRQTAAKEPLKKIKCNKIATKEKKSKHSSNAAYLHLPAHHQYYTLCRLHMAETKARQPIFSCQF